MALETPPDNQKSAEIFSAQISPIGIWKNSDPDGAESEVSAVDALGQVNQSVYAVRGDDGSLVFRTNGSAELGSSGENGDSAPLLAFLPAVNIANLGNASFCRTHGVKYPYIAGAMANGIASVEVVVAMAKAGMIGFFGAAGLSLDRIEESIDRIQAELTNDEPYGFNLIHSPHEMAHEMATVDLYLERGVDLISASAYLGLTLPVVKYRVSRIHKDADGNIIAPNRVIAKVSRVEVATKFMSPPPEKMLQELVASGDITQEQADLAAQIPMACDISAESDSGGHTDNRPALSMLPSFLALRDRIQDEFQYPEKIRVGLGGGISTPASAAAAFAMGAAYILTGSVNQACVEAGTSEQVREMLAQAQQADVAMAPAADMFEMGVEVQVLKRGTMFSMRAAKLHELYRNYNSMEELPQAEKDKLEKQFFRASLEETWQNTKRFFAERDPRQNERAEKDPKHKMALVFRSYLGQASKWANSGEASRVIDYQVWCGPAMGAFNEWVKGSFLEQKENRKVDVVAMNLLYGAAYLSRIAQLKQRGIAVPGEWEKVEPQELEEIRTKC